MNTMDQELLYDVWPYELAVLANCFSFVEEIDKYKISAESFTNKRYGNLLVGLLSLKTIPELPDDRIKEAGRLAREPHSDLLETPAVAMEYNLLKMRAGKRNIDIKILSMELDGLDETEIHTRLDNLLKTETEQNDVTSPLELLEQQIARVERNKTEKGTTGLKTGFARLDDRVSMVSGQLVILAARPSVGKSALALNQAIGAASRGKKVLYVTLEMTELELMDRAFAFLTKKPISDFKRGDATSETMSLAAQEWSSLGDRLVLHFMPGATSGSILSLARQVKPDVLVIDHMDLLSDKRLKSETEATAIGRITARLKAFAGKNKCIVYSLSQFNRESKGGVPRLHELRGSGAKEQDADAVLILHRDIDDQDSEVILNVAKNRSGETGALKLLFDAKRTTFTEPRSYD